MDDSTLQGLCTAYSSAPSPELGKILILEYMEREDVEKCSEYLNDLADKLNSSDLSEVFQRLLEKGMDEQANILLSSNTSEHLLLWIHHLIKQGKLSQAKTLYQQLLEEHPTHETEELTTLLLKHKTHTAPKLKVVEKVDMAEIVKLQVHPQSSTSFDDVVGLEKIKKQISKKIIMPFQKPSLFQKFRKKIGGGVLLYGPPGCGKTLLARATAGECKASFYNIEISDVLDMYIGESEQKLHAIFEKARNESPSVIFFDELEALAGKREQSRNSSQNNTISQFLTELDGFSQNNEGVLVLGSTNVPWSIDPAFLRPGRFDRMFFVPPPDRTARAAILAHHMKGRPAERNINFNTLAAKASAYSGADLANLVEMATDEAIDLSLESNEDVDISMAHFKAALEESRSTTTEWLTTARNYARYANDGGRYDDVLNFINKHGK